MVDYGLKLALSRLEDDADRLHETLVSVDNLLSLPIKPLDGDRLLTKCQADHVGSLLEPHLKSAILCHELGRLWTRPRRGR